MESELIIDKEGITAIDKEDSKKQIRYYTEGGSSILEGTLDGWETMDFRVVDSVVAYKKERDSQ